MQLPEIITHLPEIELPFPPDAVKTSALKSDKGLLVFFQILKDIEVPAHSHKAQWGTVLDGQIELTISGETKIYRPGESYHIPAGAMHSAKLPAGSKIIDFFEEPDRYKVK
ncbi:MAG: cupin domain-containing protein [Pseudolabrys sp.]|jgi:quercetin dioxygenase-like cupin family protein